VGAENARQISQRVLEIMARRYPGSLALPRTPYAASIPVSDLAAAETPVLGGSRFGLVGDAANLTDPITGEGIQHAIDSGALLAAALDEAGPEQAAGLYARRWMESTGRDLLTCTKIAHYLYRPSTVRLTLRFCGRSSRLRALLVDCLMVVQPYSQMWKRVLADFTPFGDKSARRSING
jgi:flavin-dependent dehydrogenase